MTTTRRTAAALVLATGLGLAGCGGGATATADCTSQIRAGGAIFSSYGSTRQAATRHGTAVVADCDDVGADAQGSVFTGSSAQVVTFRFAAYPPSEVLGVRHGRGYDVYVADDVPARDRDLIRRELGRGPAPTPTIPG